MWLIYLGRHFREFKFLLFGQLFYALRLNLSQISSNMAQFLPIKVLSHHLSRHLGCRFGQFLIKFFSYFILFLNVSQIGS